MKTEEKLLTPELQPVTWGNRVATILMTGLVWFFPFAMSVWSNTWTINVVFFYAGMFGVYAATTALLVALVARVKQQQQKFRAIAWCSIPIWLVSGLVGAIVFENFLGQFSQDEPPILGMIVGQFTLLFAICVYCKKSKD